MSPYGDDGILPTSLPNDPPDHSNSFAGTVPFLIPVSSHSLFNGDDGIRTHDPLLAGQVLSQLSYTPIWFSWLFFSFNELF